MAVSRTQIRERSRTLGRRRALTGAIVLAITRRNESVLVPGSNEALQGGDVLAVAGTLEAVHAAAALLLTPPAEG